MAAAGDVVGVGRRPRGRRGRRRWSLPVAGLVATAPSTLTRPAAISSLACSRERARPRRTSSASSRRRRGGTSQPCAVAADRRRPAAGAATRGRLEDRHVLVHRQVRRALRRTGQHLVDGGASIRRLLVGRGRRLLRRGLAGPRSRQAGRSGSHRTVARRPPATDSADQSARTVPAALAPACRPVVDRPSRPAAEHDARPAAGAGCGSRQATEVGRDVRRAHSGLGRDQLAEAGDPGHHQQAVPAHRDAHLRCRCRAGHRPRADARRRPGRGSPRTAAAAACRRPAARARRTARPGRPGRRCPGPIPLAVGTVMSVLLDHPRQARRGPGSPRRSPGSTACPGRSPATTATGSSRARSPARRPRSLSALSRPGPPITKTATRRRGPGTSSRAAAWALVTTSASSASIPSSAQVVGDGVRSAGGVVGHEGQVHPGSRARGQRLGRARRRRRRRCRPRRRGRAPRRRTPWSAGCSAEAEDSSGTPRVLARSPARDHRHRSVSSTSTASVRWNQSSAS